jgi:thiol-disulfide isomerase/thioredoxin
MLRLVSWRDLPQAEGFEGIDGESDMSSKVIALVVGIILGAAGAATFFVVREYRVLDRYQRHQASLENGPLDVVPFDVEDLYNLGLTRPDGTPGPSLRESRQKVLFVGLWASWCAPCVAEFEGVERLRRAVGEGVDFYLLSDEKPEEIRPMAKKFDLPFYSFGDRWRLPSYLRTYEVLPRTFIIRRDRIAFERWGAAPWGSAASVKFLRDLVQADDHGFR